MDSSPMNLFGSWKISGNEPPVLCAVWPKNYLRCRSAQHALAHVERHDAPETIQFCHLVQRKLQIDLLRHTVPSIRARFNSRRKLTH